MGLRMGKKQQLTPEQVTEIFASLDSSGVLDPSDAARALSGKVRRRPKRAARVVDPLSEEDPSGSYVSGRITKSDIAKAQNCDARYNNLCRLCDKNGDGCIDREELIDYYREISPSIDTDEYFIQMLTAAWKL